VDIDAGRPAASSHLSILFGEALEDVLPPGGVAEHERDPPVDIDPLELDEG
jgi:hypothetical protein